MAMTLTCVEQANGRRQEAKGHGVTGKVESGPGVIESAFGLLDILRAVGRARLTELTVESGLPRTTVHRLLGQLAAVGVVERIGPHYRLGSGLLALGQHVTPMERLRTVAQRPLIELAAATPAHVGLATTASSSPVYLEVFNGRDRLPFLRVPGEPMPAGSAGARVLSSGVAVAIDDSDSIDGVSCAAVEIPLPGGDTAAVGVVVPMSRLPRGMLAPLRTTANRIAALLAVQQPASASPSR
jgi:DNA-binding IclR family transcriptional regulator